MEDNLDGVGVTTKLGTLLGEVEGRFVGFAVGGVEGGPVGVAVGDGDGGDVGFREGAIVGLNEG